MDSSVQRYIYVNGRAIKVKVVHLGLKMDDGSVVV